MIIFSFFVQIVNKSINIIIYFITIYNFNKKIIKKILYNKKIYKFFFYILKFIKKYKKI